MFVSRANNENAIYEQQTAAAAKPLNQGVKGLAPKTPGNKAPKTPFKVPLNDENAALGAGKTGGKGKQAALFGEDKSGKVESNAFMTPAGPRNRAPLGMKTTNAKATAFQTPGVQNQEKLSAKHTSPRMRRAKIKIHEAETETTGDDEEEREIEYMAPRGEPLPDHPDDCWPIDRTYPQFEGKNLTRGWMSEFAPQKDDEDEDQFSDLDEKIRRIEELNEKKKRQTQQAKKPAAVKQSPMQKTTRDPLTTKAPQGLSSKSAASALSSSTKPALGKTARTPAPSALASKKPPTVALGNTRHTAAKVASNSTLGYSKGRAVSATARKPLSDIMSKPPPRDETNSPFASALKGSKAKTLDELFDFDELMLGDAPIKSETDAQEDDELECFQLDVVEL